MATWYTHYKTMKVCFQFIQVMEKSRELQTLTSNRSKIMRYAAYKSVYSSVSLSKPHPNLVNEYSLILFA